MNDNPQNIEAIIKELQSTRETLTQLRYQHEMILRWVEESAMLKIDSNGTIIDATDPALKILGWERSEFIGLNFHTTLQHTMEDGSEYPWEFSPVFAAIEDGSTHHVDGEIFWAHQGTNFSVDYIACATRNDRNEINGATITFRNLTEKRLQDAKRIHGMKLESIGQLSAGIAHEINTPMQFVASNLDFLRESFDDIMALVQQYQQIRKILEADELLKDLCTTMTDKEEEIDLEYISDEVPAAFEQTREGVNRVVKLVQGLKGFAHSDSNDEKHSADLNEIIKNALLVCRNEYKYVARLETDFEDIPQVDLHAGDIGQVIVNLIINAAHALEGADQTGQQQGIIRVSTRTDVESVIFSVQDNGKGITEDVRNKVFDPFFTTKEVGKGSGQGLAISRSIIEEKHGGTIDFTTEPGKGTTFTVHLPLSGF